VPIRNSRDGTKAHVRTLVRVHSLAGGHLLHQVIRFDHVSKWAVSRMWRRGDFEDETQKSGLEWCSPIRLCGSVTGMKSQKS